MSKIHGTKAQINSVVMGMQQQLATVRMAGSLQQSTDVMRNMQQLVKVILSFDYTVIKVTCIICGRRFFLIYICKISTS